MKHRELSKCPISGMHVAEAQRVANAMDTYVDVTNNFHWLSYQGLATASEIKLSVA